MSQERIKELYFKIGSEFPNIDAFINSLGNRDRRAIGMNSKRVGDLNEFALNCVEDGEGKGAFGNKDKNDKREKLFQFCEANEVSVEDILSVKKKNKSKNNTSIKKQSVIALSDKPNFQRKRKKLYNIDKKLYFFLLRI